MEWPWDGVFWVGLATAVLGAIAVAVFLSRLVGRGTTTPKSPTANDIWFVVAVFGIAFLFMTGSTWGSIKVTKEGLEFTREAVAEAIEATESAVANDALTRAQLDSLVITLQAQNSLSASSAQGLRVRIAQAKDSSRATLDRLRTARSYLGPINTGRAAGRQR